MSLRRSKILSVISIILFNSTRLISVFSGIFKYSRNSPKISACFTVSIPKSSSKSNFTSISSISYPVFSEMILINTSSRTPLSIIGISSREVVSEPKNSFII